MSDNLKTMTLTEFMKAENLVGLSELIKKTADNKILYFMGYRKDPTTGVINTNDNVMVTFSKKLQQSVDPGVDEIPIRDFLKHKVTLTYPLDENNEPDKTKPRYKLIMEGSGIVSFEEILELAG